MDTYKGSQCEDVSLLHQPDSGGDILNFITM